MWGGGALERKPHLVRSTTVCLDKRKGRLGVKSLALLDKALLGKWSWHFANEKEAFWNQVIRGQIWGGTWWVVFAGVREGYGVGLWKAIRKFGHLVSSRISFVVGNGQRCVFDGTTPLCKSFPTLFALATSKRLNSYFLIK